MVHFFEGLSLNAWVVLIIFLGTVWALIRETRPPEVVMLASVFLLVATGAVSPKEALQGVSNEIIPLIASLCVIVKALEVNGVLDRFARAVLSRSKQFLPEIASVVFPTGLMSAFLNNTIIVLLMTPIVKRWALQMDRPPSKFLIPISYAAILGGSCTLIGSSTNLMVQALMLEENPAFGFSLFEIGKVGLPLFIILGSILCFAAWLLPERKNPTAEVEVNIESMTARFTVNKDSPLIGSAIGGDIFRGAAVIELERNGHRYHNPNEEFELKEGDHLLLASDLHRLAELHQIKGLDSYADPGFELDVKSSHFLEIVITAVSFYIGKTLDEIRFRRSYGASILAIYRDGAPLKGMIRHIPLRAGDVLVAITDQPEKVHTEFSSDYFVIRKLGKLHTFNLLKGFFSLASLGAVVVSSIAGFSLLISSCIASAALLVFRIITFEEAYRSIVWMVLLVIACSFAIGKALTASGLSQKFAGLMLSIVGEDPVMMLSALLLMTVALTEVLSNNASAVIMFPIGVGMFSAAGYYSPETIKAIGAAVLIGSSSGYALPTGYQTHMIVYGPGGYRFKDFLVQGISFDILTWIAGSILIPLIFPLVKV